MPDGSTLWHHPQRCRTFGHLSHRDSCWILHLALGPSRRGVDMRNWDSWAYSPWMVNGWFIGSEWMVHGWLIRGQLMRLMDQWMLNWCWIEVHGWSVTDWLSAPPKAPHHAALGHGKACASTAKCHATRESASSGTTSLWSRSPFWVNWPCC